MLPPDASPHMSLYDGPSDDAPESEFTEWKYQPWLLVECEDLENYEPGGFHPVHLGDRYDDRYRVVHKLGYGGFSTVWLARDGESAWAALKIVTARESPTYEARSAIASHPSINKSRYFATTERTFWIDGPNGHHVCLVFPVLGPDLSQLSRGIYSRISAAFVRELSLQAATALAYLHANGLCHGDMTASNMVVRLNQEFDFYDEARLLQVFGDPRTYPVITYDGGPPGPHAPDYNVVPLDFCSAPTNLLSCDICIIDFDQSFDAANPPVEQPGIPAKYLAPEVAVGQAASPASDVWALGCAFFRIRSGDDLFFNYDTNSPIDVLREIVRTIGALPEEWADVRFDEDGVPVASGQSGEPFSRLGKIEPRPLDDRVRAIVDEPAGLFINARGEARDVPDAGEEPSPAQFPDDAIFRVPYSAAYSSMLWKPTAVCFAGVYIVGYDSSGETDGMLKRFPKISESETLLLVDLLS